MSAVYRTLAHAFTGGNPAGLTSHDVSALVAYVDQDEERTHAHHIHPQRDTMGSMCPVCEPETYARLVTEDVDKHDTDSAREFASAYRKATR